MCANDSIISAFLQKRMKFFRSGSEELIYPGFFFKNGAVFFRKAVAEAKKPRDAAIHCRMPFGHKF